MDCKTMYLSSLLFSFSLIAGIKEDLQYDKDWPYQDILINGEVIMQGYSMDCPSRYAALRPLLDRFKRPFTVLDVGANNGYFCWKIAQDYDACCVMIDGTDRLKKISQLNTELSSVIYLQKYINEDEIEELAEIEHFDVILCFHLLHHVDYTRFIPALFRMGDHVIIETPPTNDGFVHLKPSIPVIANYLTSLPEGLQIGSFQRQSPKIMDHMILFSHPLQNSLIYRDFENAKQFSNETQSWEKIPCGISLKTYKLFNGVHPELKDQENSQNALYRW